MPFLFLCVFSLAAGLLVELCTWRLTAPAHDRAREVGERIGRHGSLRAMLDARLDPATATGLWLTIALALVIGGGVLLGTLAYLVRTSSHLIGLDNGVAKWGHAHATPLSTHGLNAVTWLGSINTVVALCIILAVVATIAERSVWVVPFILLVMVGNEFLIGTVKELADRVRPTFNPAAATLGPAFPSGHAGTAAAFYATAALLIGRHRGRRTRAVLAGVAAGIAVGVAASRVLLDLHWLTDVIAGLGLGWAWFAVCAIAFGGRILRFGADTTTAARAGERAEPASGGEPVKVGRSEGGP